MLDIVRRSKGFTRIILGVVVIATAGTFGVALYGIWGGALSNAEQGAPDWILVVDGHSIPVRDFQQRRTNLERNMRDRLQGQDFDEDTLGAVVDQQAVGQILGTYLAQREAHRAGLRVLPSEVSDAIVHMPVFDRGGHFIGKKTYQEIIRSQGMNVAQFENELAQELAADKMRLALFGVARVEDSDLEKRFRNEVERVDVSYVLLPDSRYMPKSKASTSELKSWYDKHTSKYMTPEARNASYVLFNREEVASTIKIPDEELRKTYEADKATRYTHGEERRASHILFKVDPSASPAQDAAKKAEAEKILKEIKGGADFAEEAKKHSEDTSSAVNGGDLGWFERGRMVQQFEDAVFKLPANTVGDDVVKTPFGYHIIECTGIRPAGTRTFDEVKDEIRRDLSVQRAQDEIRAKADAFTTKLASETSSFDKTASEMGLKVDQTGFFTRGQPAGPLGRLPLVEDAVFSLAQGAHSAAVTVPQGLAVFTLDEVQAPKPETFDQVKSQVEKDFNQERAREVARTTAQKITEGSGDLAKRVAGRGLEVKSLAAVTRAHPMPPLTDAAKEAAFTAPKGSVVGPFESADGLLVLEVIKKDPSTPEEEAAEKATLREQMLQEARVTLYNSAMSRLQRTSAIQVNEGLLRKSTASR